MVQSYSFKAILLLVTSLIVIWWLNNECLAKAKFSGDRLFPEQTVNQPQKTLGLRAVLMHVDHVDSPFKNLEQMTDIARIRNDVYHIAARESFLYEKIMNNLPANSLTTQARRKLLETWPDSPFAVNPIRLTSDRTNSVAGNYESEVSLTGSGYSMSISVGTPPQHFRAFADTGSDMPWIQCSPCERCFLQDDHFFDPALSSSYEQASCSSSICEQLQDLQNFAGCESHCTSAGCYPSCQYDFTYGDQTHSSGDMALETLTLSTSDGAPISIPGFVFGCGHDNTGSLNETGASGIIGLGRGGLSFPSQLKHYLGANRFSTCFVDREAALEKTSPLLFGEAATSLPGMQYTPMVSGNESVDAFYHLHLEGVSVGGLLVPVVYRDAGFYIDSSTGLHGTILDSGSTLTSLVPHLYSRVMAEIIAQAPAYPTIDLSSNGLDLCFIVTDVADPVLPILTFHLKNATWAMPNENMALILRDGEGGLYMCLALTRSKYGMNIIGNIQQQNFQILYDLDNERIGFAKAECDTV